jgi:hypothetical protein
MKLSDFQALFQSRLLAGPGAEDAPLIAALRESGRGAGRDELLHVYQSGYRVRLESFLHEDYPGLRALLGEERFEALIGAYVTAQPPRDRNARWYTTGLPDFLRDHPEWKEDAAASSMALFERAIVDAFDAPDAEPLAVQALAGFAPEESPRLVFDFHPSLIVLRLAPGVFAAYQAMNGDGESGDGVEDSEAERAGEEGFEAVAVWRCNEESVFRELEPDEYLALNEARVGRAFGDICQMAAFQHAGEIEPERLAQFLASWFEDGMITGVSLQG